MTQKIRPISICIFYHKGRILATEAYDKVKKQYFYRSIGGGIEFQESGSEALIREVREELNTEITNIKLLGVFENIFVYNGKQGHEIVFVYDAKFKDKSFYKKENIPVLEGKIKSNAVWLTINKMPKDKPIYPDGLIKSIKKLI